MAELFLSPYEQLKNLADDLESGTELLELRLETILAAAGLAVATGSTDESTTS